MHGQSILAVISNVAFEIVMDIYIVVRTFEQFVCIITHTKLGFYYYTYNIF